MKRFLTTCAALLMALVLCCPMVFASAPESYYLEEMDADIALPSWDNYYFLYPDMPADSLDLQYLGMTPEEINELLAASDILLDVLYADYSHEISVYVTEDTMTAEMFNYQELSELEREIVLAANSTMFGWDGSQLLRGEWESAGNAVWLVLEYLVYDSVWGCQYSTVCNGKGLTIDAVMYLEYGDSEEMREEVRAAAALMAEGTVFRSIESTPENVGGITGNMISEVLTETGMDSIDLSEAGLGTVDLTEVDLSNFDLEGVVDALGLTEEEAIKIVKGEKSVEDLDLSNADPIAVMDAVGIPQEELVDVALSAVGFGDLDWQAMLYSAGRGALIGAGGAVVVIALIIVLLAVCGRKRRGVTASEPAAEE